MPDKHFYEDQSEFSSFIKNYSSELEKDYNKIIKARSHILPFHEYLTVPYPKLKQKSDMEWVPIRKIPCVRIRHYYITRVATNTARILTYIKVSKYEKRDYKKSGLSLSYSVVNRVHSIVLSRDKNELCQTRLLSLLKRLKGITFQDYYYGDRKFECMSISSKGKRILNEYYSDFEWESMLSYFSSN